MDKFKNKYRIPSNRKTNWDYSANALYFLTIVTQNRVCNLGEIVEIVDGVNGAVLPQPQPPTYKMVLSDYGKIVEQEWFKSFEIRNELILHEFVLMPNHLHAIVEICMGNDVVGDVTYVDARPCVSTATNTATNTAANTTANNNNRHQYSNKTQPAHSFTQINFVIHCRI